MKRRFCGAQSGAFLPSEFMRKTTKQATARKRGKRISFVGLDVCISERVRKGWDTFKKSDHCISLLEATSKALKRHRWGPIEKALRAEIAAERAREEYFKKNPFGPDILNAQVQLVIAYNDGDVATVRRLAEKKRKEISGSKKSRDADSFVSRLLTELILTEWLNNDGLCLAWFSPGALDLLLGATGLHSVSKDGAEAIKKRVKRLGLKGIVPALIEKRDVEIDGKLVILH